nr:phage baseplate assembly protein [Desulfobacteraceae bacterium]
MMVRGIVKAITDGLVRMLSASGMAGQSFDNREIIQHYGMASSPLPGAEVVLLVHGNVITAIGSDDRRYRIALDNGEVALYTDEGDMVHLRRNRIIDIIGGEQVNVTTKVANINASSQVTLNTPDVFCS